MQGLRPFGALLKHYAGKIILKSRFAHPTAKVGLVPFLIAPKKHFYRFLPYKSKNNFWKNQSQVIVGYAAVVVVLKANAVGANRRYQPNKKKGEAQAYAVFHHPASPL
ncbi:MAG: hypothetical protein MUP17_01405 [candidate division Zixibacteria bacterium]|nr:hypothetical protein [candidate division Zixibacteria bacterium]